MQKYKKLMTFVQSFRESQNHFSPSMYSICMICIYKADAFSKCEALPSGHVETVKLLVSRGADMMCKDKQGYTPLHAAAASGQIDTIRYLLSLGVEVRLIASLFENGYQSSI